MVDSDCRRCCGGHQNYLAFPDIGVPIDGHAVGHGQSANGMTPDQIHVKVRQFHCKLIADMAAKLDAVREGDGTMLDRTLIVCHWALDNQPLMGASKPAR